jgi:hypothetical protein
VGVEEVLLQDVGDLARLAGEAEGDVGELLLARARAHRARGEALVVVEVHGALGRVGGVRPRAPAARCRAKSARPPPAPRPGGTIAAAAGGYDCAMRPSALAPAAALALAAALPAHAQAGARGATLGRPRGGRRAVRAARRRDGARRGARAVTTDADGRFRVAGLPDGPLAVDAARAGYDAAARTVTLRAPELGYAELRLRAGGGGRGRRGRPRRRPHHAWPPCPRASPRAGFSGSA